MQFALRTIRRISQRGISQRGVRLSSNVAPAPVEGVDWSCMLTFYVVRHFIILLKIQYPFTVHNFIFIVATFVLLFAL